LKGREKDEKISQVHGINIKMRNVYRNSFKKDKPGTWHTYKDEKCLQKLFQKKNPQTKKGHFGIYFWKGSFNKTYPKEIGFKDMNWVYLVHDKNHS
jgi:hypothetical protein